jgi:Translationally controlled tumour protein
MCAMQIKAFMAAAPGFVKYLLTQFNELQFYVGSSFDPNGAMAFSYYKEGASTPTFIFITGGLKAAKVRRTCRLLQRSPLCTYSMCCINCIMLYTHVQVSCT